MRKLEVVICVYINPNKTIFFKFIFQFHFFYPIARMKYYYVMYYFGFLEKNYLLVNDRVSTNLYVPEL